MTTATETETKLDGDVLTQWPPLAHLSKEKEPKEGDLALCGARLMGIKLPEAAEVCEECLRIAQEEQG